MAQKAKGHGFESHQLHSTFHSRFTWQWVVNQLLGNWRRKHGGNPVSTGLGHLYSIYNLVHRLACCAVESSHYCTVLHCTVLQWKRNLTGNGLKNTNSYPIWDFLTFSECHDTHLSNAISLCQLKNWVWPPEAAAAATVFPCRLYFLN